MAYTKYSLTPADNNAAPPNGAPEGMLPSGVNDTMRDMMSQIRDAGDGIRNGTYTMTAPVITGGSITGVALSGNTLTNPVITGAAISTSTLTGNTFTNPVISGGSINNTPIGATTATTATFTTATVNKIEDAQGGVLAPISSVMRNRIINGAMVIDQRNAGASVTPANGNYTLDRWRFGLSQASKLTFQQNAGSVTPPVGFINYGGITSSSAYSVISTDYFTYGQAIEGLNMGDLGWGTANAKTVTLSFQVRSSLTGTFGGSLYNSDGSRSYPFSYTISSANTWTSISVTIAGDTSGTWLTTNGIGVWIVFGLGVGSTFSGTAGAWAGAFYLSATGATSVVGTNGATFYITGVQLERGTQATSFEYRQYGTELALCQRYLPCLNSLSTDDPISLSFIPATTIVRCDIPFKVTPRVPPTGISVSSASHVTWDTGVASGTASAVSFTNASSQTGRVALTVTGATIGQSAAVSFNSASGQILFTGCEL